MEDVDLEVVGMADCYVTDFSIKEVCGLTAVNPVIVCFNNHVASYLSLQVSYLNGVCSVAGWIGSWWLSSNEFRLPSTSINDKTLFGKLLYSLELAPCTNWRLLHNAMMRSAPCMQRLEWTETDLKKLKYHDVNNIHNGTIWFSS